MIKNQIMIPMEHQISEAINQAFDDKQDTKSSNIIDLDRLENNEVEIKN